VLLRLPHPDQVQGTFADRAVVAQLSHASRTPRLMINACAWSYAFLNWSTSPSKRAINMTASPDHPTGDVPMLVSAQ
jgi:hypothetical protein